MAPEQMSNSDVDYRADVWSLGVMLYECLSGTRPIEGQNMAEVIARLIGDAIVPLDRLAPELPHDVTALVQQMLTRDPGRRLQDLSELTKVLGRFARLAVPSFGPPQTPDVAHVATHYQSRRSAPPVPVVRQSAASIRRTTMLSAPAVGMEGRRSAVESAATPSPQAGRLRLAFAVGAGVLTGLLLFLFRGTGSERAPSPAVASPAPARPAAAESIASTSEPLPAAPQPKPSAERERPAAPAASAKPPRQPGNAALHNRPLPSKPPAAPNSEDALFSGRK
jgi:serine/threonine-protein kinase